MQNIKIEIKPQTIRHTSNTISNENCKRTIITIYMILGCINTETRLMVMVIHIREDSHIR